ncbi:MAG: heavy metal-associated domain-containing protein [Deltaproteobacteria bacterium]|nr:heavy metal-associated domain-containing protein [Deltaproteobacteria bacterium]
MKSKIFVWLLVFGLQSLVFGPVFSQAEDQASPPPKQVKETKTLTLKIDGMTCGACAKKVKRELSKVCDEASIDLQKGEGVCKYQDPVTPAQILKEAQKSGFDISVKN